MRKFFSLVLLASMASGAFLLAKEPAPKKCDAWDCKGEFCAPAKYAAIRNPVPLSPFQASPTYLAAAFEGTSALLLGGVGALVIRRRRAADEERWIAARPSDVPES